MAGTTRLELATSAVTARETRCNERGCFLTPFLCWPAADSLGHERPRADARTSTKTDTILNPSSSNRTRAPTLFRVEFPLCRIAKPRSGWRPLSVADASLIPAVLLFPHPIPQRGALRGECRGWKGHSLRQARRLHRLDLNRTKRRNSVCGTPEE